MALIHSYNKTMPSPLLASKLSLPLPRPNTVLRLRLLEQLSDGLYCNGFHRKLTLVAAPAGYGKTTLIVDWLNNLACDGQSDLLDDLSIAWLALDEGDNDPIRFFSYLIACLQQGAGIGKGADSILQSVQPPPLDIILATLLNELTSLQTPLILVLDDYHCLSTPQIHKQLAYLLDNLPLRTHLVVLSREDPPLPLARLRARGKLLEIRQQDLQFTSAEASDFLQRVMGIFLAPSDLSALERRTEGWITGLQLAAISLKGREDQSAFIRSFSGSSRFILDYLIEEVFEDQSAEVQKFLLKTSILPRFSGPLCDAVLDSANSQRMLEALEDANLFIHTLDQSRAWYRYHRLFAELLNNRLRLYYPQLEAELHNRAASWFEVQGFNEEAIQHSISSQDWERAARLIQTHNGEYLKRGELLTVLKWFQILPEEILVQNPRLCFDYCWVLLLTGQFSAAEPLLADLETVAEDTPPFLGEIYAAQAYLARGLDDQTALVERSNLALQNLPVNARQSRGIVSMNLGLAYWHSGQMESAEGSLKLALESALATDNVYAAITSIIFQGRVHAVRGELKLAKEYFLKAVEEGREIPINILANMDLATLHYEWNELERSEFYLQKALAKARQVMNYEFLAACLMLGSRLKMGQGDIAAAEGHLEAAWRLAKEGKIPPRMTERLAAADAFLRSVQGKLTEELGAKLDETVDSHPFYRFLGLAKSLPMTSQEARPYLRGLQETALENGWIYGAIAVGARQAVLAETPKQAREHLVIALRMAREGGFIRSFLEAGENLIPLLEESVNDDTYKDHAGRILEAFKVQQKSSPTANQTLVEPLSQRELEVLQLLVEGLSNREIAERLVISTGTAKTHVHNLCVKLGVRNRTEAAVKAQALKLT
jgi:LuxR family maltose regulon positive regulatory protein